MRTEQTAATSVLEQLPALDGRPITADALHAYKPNARLIAEKGGEYLLQIKANQPALLAQAQALNALQDTPFLSNRAKPTAAVKPAPCTPSPSNPTPSASPTPEA